MPRIAKTLINESLRAELNITRNEYALLIYVFKVGNGEYLKEPKENTAEFIGITRSAMYRMINRMVFLKLLERDKKLGIKCSSEFLSKIY